MLSENVLNKQLLKDWNKDLDTASLEQIHDSLAQLVAREVLKQVQSALQKKGYNPINQIVGYILSGDPTYITSYNDARNLIRQLDRDELLEKLVRNYIGLDE